jgi:hypothetical protein
VTYILTWKFGSAIYLVADTAVTVDQHVVDSTYTSFEEKSVSQPDKSVYEGALKLINLGRAALAMAGDSMLAQSIVETFKQALRQTDNPREALHTAIMSNRPFHPERSCTLVIAFPNSPTPTLLSFNLHNDQNIIEHYEDCFLPIGSLPVRYDRRSFSIIDFLSKGFCNKPYWFLTFMLALVQSYGIHEVLLEKYAGGAYCGLLVGVHSIEWQPDILFYLYDEGRNSNVNTVSSIIRDHVLIVRSLFTKTTTYFFNALSCDSIEDWNSKWFLPAHQFTTDGRFDFIVFLSRQFRIITIIEMFKHQSNQFLSITPRPSERPLESVTLDLGLSPQLIQVMDEPAPDRYDGTTPFAVNWYPYCRTCQWWTPHEVPSGKPVMCSQCRVMW